MKRKRKNYWHLGPRQQKRRLQSHREENTCVDNPSSSSEESASTENVNSDAHAVSDEKVVSDTNEIGSPKAHDVSLSPTSGEWSNEELQSYADMIDEDVDFADFDDVCAGDNVTRNATLYWELNYSDDDDDDDDGFYDVFLVEEFCEKLANICCRGMSRTKTTEICKLLKSDIAQLKDMPGSARRLFGTPKNTSALLTDMSPGKYYHFGIRENIIRLCSQISPDELPQVIEIAVNMDGLPISKSSKKQFWPILARISNIPKLRGNIFIVGLYCGDGKPQDWDHYVKEFVDEANELFEEGVTVHNRNMSLRTSFLAFDAPAKADIMGVGQHQSYHGCTKCHAEGARLTGSGRTFYPARCGKCRTHLEFSNQTDGDYHMRPAYIIHLKGIDLVASVPLDYLHLVCLGVVKKLIGFWVRGPQKNKRFKLDGVGIGQISELLTDITKSRCVPSEFQRKPRGFSELAFWKGVEYRLFLLFVGVVALREKFTKDLRPAFDHFILLHVAITLLVSPRYCKLNISLARKIIQEFVEKFKKFYGAVFISYNVHNLLHLADDCERFGPLDLFSCFAFESFLGILKAYLLKKSQHLQQVVNRLTERNYLETIVNDSLVFKGFQASEEWSGTRLEPPGYPGYPEFRDMPQYRVLSCSNFTIKCGKYLRDSCCGLKDGSVVIVDTVVRKEEDGKLFIFGKKLRGRQNLYVKPFKSKHLGSHVFSKQSEFRLWPADEVFCKYFVIPQGSSYYAFPLQHSYLI